jgi:uncharacterized BrkB/YihY/UPF0761 family membrane protein
VAPRGAPDATRGRERGARARVAGSAARVRARAEQERERRFVVALAFALVDRSRQAAAAVLAGAIAFRLFLTLLPLVLVLVVGLGYLKTDGGTPSDALRQFGIKGALANTINQSASFSNPGRTVVLVLGLFGVLSGASACAAAVRAIHALAWRMPVARWRRRGAATLLFLGGVVVMFACAGIASRVRIAAGVVLGFWASLALAVIVAGVWLTASWLLPHRADAPWTALAPGSVLIGAGFAVLQTVTVNWISPKLDHETSLYGSLGVAFVLLGWLYIVGRLMVAAPLLNAALLERREARRDRHH